MADEWADLEGLDPVDQAERVLSVAVNRVRPVKVFALFSGGHDSLCAADVASLIPYFDGCVHIDTGIEQTREFVRATCCKQGWPLLEYRPPVSYEEIVLR